MTTDAKLAAIETKLVAIEVKLAGIEGKLADLYKIIDNLPVLMMMNSTSQADKLLNGFKDALVQQKEASKAKKEVVSSTGGETKEGKKAETATKATHPKFGKIAKTAWEKKVKAGTEHEKISAFLIAMQNHYKSDLATVIGEQVTKEVEEQPDYKSFIATKHTPTEVATKFITSMWAMLGATNRIDDVSKRVVAFYQKELEVLNGQKIDLVNPESQTAAEKDAVAMVLTTTTTSTTASAV